MINEILNPADYGLNSRTVLKKIKNNRIAIVINRKSLIIMKDGEGILHKADTVRSVDNGIKISLMTDAPVCGKTEIFLKENGIDIIPLN